MSGAKSDSGDAHMLADMVRTDSPPAARGWPATAPTPRRVKVAGPRAQEADLGADPARCSGCGHALREYFPAALEAFDGPGRPRRAGTAGARRRTRHRPPKLTRAQITAALKRARRRDDPGARATAILAALRSAAPGPAGRVTAAYAAYACRSAAAVITVLNEQVKITGSQGERSIFGRHPDAEIYLSQPGIGAILGARVLGEFGDDPGRYAVGEGPQELRRHQPRSPAPPARRRSCRPVHPQRPDSSTRCMAQALSALSASPGARAFYDDLRARGTDHNDALRQRRQPPRRHPARMPENRTEYDEATAWSHRAETPEAEEAA